MSMEDFIEATYRDGIVRGRELEREASRAAHASEPWTVEEQSTDGRQSKRCNILCAGKVLAGGLHLEVGHRLADAHNDTLKP